MAANANALAQLRLTHRSDKLERFTLEFSNLLVRLIHDPSAQIAPLACAAAERLGFPAGTVIERSRPKAPDTDVIGGLLSSACYIEHSLPAVLYLAARYADDFEAALGFAAIPPRWIEGLTARVALDEEIETFIARFG